MFKRLAVIINCISIDNISEGEQSPVCGPIWGHKRTSGAMQGCDEVNEMSALMMSSLPLDDIVAAAKHLHHTLCPVVLVKLF